MIKNIKIKKPYLKIACILDEFSYNCFKYECNLIQLHVSTWKQVITKEKPDLLFVESTWKGLRNSWKKKIYDINISKDTTLKALVNYCNNLNIPTIFWNKEDPFHFEKFIYTAKLFDYVFTTSEESIKNYIEKLNHNKVFCLPFAAQPQIHSPIDKDKRKINNVCFAGTWYVNKYPQRKKDLDFLLTSAMKYSVHIYDRTYNVPFPTKKHYQFPSKFMPYIKGALPYNKVVEAYKKYKLFLNVNTITDSRSMFSRRVFELLACGTPVISNYALGIDVLFPSIVKLVKSKDETDRYLKVLLDNKDYRDRLSLRGQREVFNKHTYTHRLNYILNKIGFNYKKEPTYGVSIITITDDLSSIENIISNFTIQRYRKKELIIILKNKKFNLNETKKSLLKYPEIKIIQTEKTRSYRDCLTSGIKNSIYDYISIFDSKDYYAPNFLIDLMNTFKYTNGKLSGKLSHYCFLKNKRNLMLIAPNSEFQYTNYLYTSTLIINKDLFNIIKLRTGSKEIFWNDFFNQCIKKQIKLYSSDKFNYVHIADDISKLNSKFHRNRLFANRQNVKLTGEYKKQITV
ncbi:glycosyltransferase family protein [Oceanirhabdus sp. W0125-5]|uniref:glycosyltransferase family protein n=1 Tax=Oceanirhabdus sp. W0125-5 TaxID=2999116 RepID=UPI0022F3010E|nr:glycosyltransferase [Oceanirhabdus sp. W0125-5]WBW96621.1 glycosyltransferase [Oceanirhabdus sp. W0125-5]